MSSIALRKEQKSHAAWIAVLFRPLTEALRRRRKARRDSRALTMLPEHVLADMGLEKINVLTGTNGSREIWVIPHRF